MNCPRTACKLRFGFGTALHLGARAAMVVDPAAVVALRSLSRKPTGVLGLGSGRPLVNLGDLAMAMACTCTPAMVLILLFPL